MNTLRWMLLLLFAVSIQAFSDARPDPNPAGSVLAPEGATKVQMVRERVLFEIQPATTKPKSPDVARVTADFYFRNRGTVAEQMQVLFPIASDSFDRFYTGKNLKVWIDGTETPTTVLKKRDTNAEYTWKAFNASFPLEREVFIRVQYDTYSLGLNTYNDAQFLNSFGYTFATGAPWYGKIENIELVLQMPYKISRENTWAEDLFGQKNKPTYLGNQAIWNWQNIEPLENSYLEFQTVPIWLWNSYLTAQAEVRQKPKNIQAHRTLIQLILQMNYWGYSISQIEGYHDIRLEQACLKVFKEFPTDMNIRLFCIEKAQEQISRDGVSESNPEMQFALRTFAEIQKIAPYNAVAEKAYTTMQNVYEQSWMTLPLQPPRPNSRGASKTITAAETVKTIAQYAALKPQATKICNDLLIQKREDFSRLDIYIGDGVSYQYKLEKNFAFTNSKKQNLNAWKAILEQALTQFGRYWNTPMWGADNQWQLRWFANLDGSRRYAVGLKILPNKTVAVCMQTYLRSKKKF